jgi:predicted lipid-binding transport protein (Tim44 family)
MKTLVVALMLFASMVLPMTSVAAAKHAASATNTANKHAQAADAAQTDAAPPPAHEEVDTSWKGQIGAAVVAMGGERLATLTGIEPVWLGVIGLTLSAILLLWIVITVVRIILRLVEHARRGPAVYAGDYLNSIMPDKELRVEPSIRPEAPRAKQVAKSKSRANAPEGFDVPKFLRSANTYFLRLQVAWDRIDLADIKEFTTREIYVELKSQLRKRGDKPNRTGVDALDAELLKLESGAGKYVASVKFSGMIREENDAAKPFMEVWSLTKSISGTEGWTLAGVQQFS